jgi:AhpD family alkylhydroperoxidase
MTRKFKTLISAAFVVSGLAVAPSAALADDMDAKAQATYDDIQKTFGSVPSFIKLLPKSAVAGIWQQTKDLEFSDNTALPPKTKALISLAVAAQIPCSYCIWSDTMAARQAGATDEEIGEAVAMAAVTRQWSTLFNGLQVDFDQFKKEMGGGS